MINAVAAVTRGVSMTGINEQGLKVAASVLAFAAIGRE